MGKRAPSPPSAQELTSAQAQANRIDQFTPFGSITFSGPNRNTATTTLTPRAQQALDAQLRAQAGGSQRAAALGRALGNMPVNFRAPGQVTRPGLPGDQGVRNALRAFNQGQNQLPGRFDVSQAPIGEAIRGFEQGLAGLGEIPEFADPTQGQIQDRLAAFDERVQGLGEVPQFETTALDRQRIEDALFNRQRRLLDPVLEQQERALRDTLANQGLPQGQEAFQDEFSRFEQSRNQALLDAADRAILAGGQEAQRQLGMDIGAFQTGLQGRGQAFGEAQGVLGAGLGAIGQQFGQGLQEFGAGLQRRGMQTGELQQLFGNQLGAQQQQFGQRATEFTNNLARQNQAFNQDLGRLGARLGAQDMLFNRGLQRFGADQARRQEMLQRALLERQVPLNELQSFLGLGQTQQPTFFGPGQVDALGANAAQMQGQQFNAGQTSGLIGNLIGAGGLLGASFLSDRSAKDDLGEAPTTLDGIKRLNVRAFRYRPGHADGGALVHIGPMADDFQEIFGLGDGTNIPIVDAFGICLQGLRELAGRVEALEGV